jgi:cell wall-associated NlpC family hydrolase
MKNKGICNLSVIPLRKEARSESEIVSQLLFGDTFTINAEADNGWIEITTDFDQYTGFISNKQFAPYQGEFSNWLTTTSFPYSTLISDNGQILLPPGSSIPSNRFELGNQLYTLESALANYNIHDIELVAKQYLNCPYLWGGKTPFGIDCSGFTQMVFKQCGITLPRDAYQQAVPGETISFIQEAQIGDLAFFDNEAGKITHVGIMLGNQHIIHASGKVRIDEIDHHGILNIDDKQYSHKLRIIKRIN